MSMSAQRSARVITLAIAAFLLTGCASLLGSTNENSVLPGADARQRAIEANPAPSPTATTLLSGAPVDLSFEADVNLDPAQWRVQWFMFGSGFSELSADDGNGSWAVIHDASRCEIHFYQGTVSGFDLTQDDRTVTDELIWLYVQATIEGSSRDDVGEFAFDDAVPLLVDVGSLPMRTIWGSGDDGSSWLYSARMFGSTGGGVSIDIACPPGLDASAMYDELRDVDQLVVDVGRASGGKGVDGATLTFGEAEEQITADWLMGWHAPFSDDDERFVLQSMAEGSTAFSYLDSDNECTIDMEVHRLADHPMNEDDRLLSDTMLAANVTGSPSAEAVGNIAAIAGEKGVWQEGKAATVEFRIWLGASERAGSAVVAARGFGEMAAGMLLAVGCPPGTDALVEYKEIVDDYARIVVRSPAGG
jgi:hypothetical protein